MEQTAPKPSSKIRAPPIFIQMVGIKPTIEYLKSMNISPADFIVREFDDKFTRIYPGSIEIYNSIIAAMKTSNRKFFTYTPRQLKIKTIVLKGIRGGYDENDVKEALEDLKLNEVRITKVSKMIFDKNKPNLYHFIVSVTHDSQTAPMTRTKRLLSQPIRWERLRKPIIFMCKRCQQTGHSSSNCHLAPVCVKCAGDHESKDCHFQTTQDRSTLKCINCNETGHPASYRGCPALKLIADARKADKQQNIMKKRKITQAINNYVKPGLTYANKVETMHNNNYYPPLPRNKTSAPSYNWPFEEPSTIQPPPQVNTLDHSMDNNSNRIDRLMADIYTTV
ncbi:uncharacterized protein LOC107274553 [Cephus cinctus]|uniref:Uncharacterized protein LOC107274553 n=1 Tax=Cephus cinctus TaxID=211228 RepID=A0AAJ7RUX3_CEPCN|nr:uncharacterized protein LOC107274553 [Cephus cinctus]